MSTYRTDYMNNDTFTYLRLRLEISQNEIHASEKNVRLVTMNENSENIEKKRLLQVCHGDMS
jgi:hypothetical protein